MTLRNATRQTVFRLTSAALSLGFPVVRALNRRHTDVPVTVLTYHSVADVNDGYWNVTPARFAAQMAFLARQRYQVLAIRDYLARRRQGDPVREPTVVITFDDGYQSVYQHAYPVLQRYGLAATVFLTPSFIGSNRLFPWDIHRAQAREQLLPLTWEEVRAMQGGLLEFGSHTLTHPHLGRLPPAEIEREVGQSKAVIEARLGTPVISFAYPGGVRSQGDFSATTRAVLERTGYQFACTSEIGRNNSQRDLLEQRRIHPTATDSLRALGAKIEGGFDWMRHGQRLFQGLFRSRSALGDKRRYRGPS